MDGAGGVVQGRPLAAAEWDAHLGEDEPAVSSCPASMPPQPWTIACLQGLPVRALVVVLVEDRAYAGVETNTATFNCTLDGV